MFIDETAMLLSTPFGGAEINGERYAQFEFRSSERRLEGSWFMVYKHLTPSGVRNQD